MKLERIYTECIAHAAYYLVNNGEVGIFDQLREVQPYVYRACNFFYLTPEKPGFCLFDNRRLFPYDANLTYVTKVTFVTNATNVTICFKNAIDICIIKIKKNIL